MLCCPSLLYKMSVNKRENIKQIPKEDNLEVQKVVSEQGGVEGQRKEVNVGNALYKNLDKTKQYQNVSEVAEAAAEFVK